VLNKTRSTEDDKNLLQRGFTLVELLIVIVILGILAGIVVFAVGNLTNNAKTNACNTEKSSITTAAEAYKAQNGSYPANMAALTSTTGSSGALLKSTPVNYTIDGSGNVTVTASGTANGCS
jgi:general secretion pathway protein G